MSVRLRLRITCIVALCAILSSTALVLGAGIAAACSGAGGGGCEAPTASTGSASSITSNSATLSGSVNARGCTTYYVFEWGTSSSGPFPDSIEGSAGKETSPKAVSTNLTGLLKPSTQYYFRLSAINSEGKKATGSAVPFKTPAGCSKPTVTTGAVASVSDILALLTGTVNPNYCPVIYWFEWGPISLPNTYPNSTPFTYSAITSIPEGVTSDLKGLQPGTGYHFRLSASSLGETINGADKTFTTPVVPQYLALGDSYSAGTGTGSDWVNNESVSATCHRTKQSYPYLISKAHPTWTFINATCHGAVTNDVLNGQIPSQVSPNIKWITYTIGGNDAGFAKVMSECVLALVPGICDYRIDEAQKFIKEQLGARLDAVNNQIKVKAPNAKVIVLDYPWLYNASLTCSAIDLTFAEKTRLNETSDLMRALINAATGRAGSKFVFVDIIPSFIGHAVCDGGSGSSIEWLNGLSSPSEESFHPKAQGHKEVYFKLANAVIG
jgi:lysophospholipase L1-like esterase